MTKIIGLLKKVPAFKTKLFQVFLLGLGFLLVMPVQAQHKPSRKDRQMQEYMTMVNLVSSRKFVYRATRAFPQSNNPQMLSSDYEVSLNDSIVSGYLPYVGNAYRNMDLSGSGFEFSDVCRNLVIESNNEKMVVSCSFVVESKDHDQLIISIESSGSNYAKLSINCNNKQPISYRGGLSPLKK